MLAAFTTLFSLTPALSQTCTTPSDAESGDDNDAITVSVTDFSCATGVTDAYITGITINTTIGSSCTSYYSHNIEIDGVEVESGLCNGSYDLSDYVYDLHSIDNISIVSADEDNYAPGDNVNMSIDADLTYIITSCPPPGDFVVTDLGSTTAELDWNPNGSESFWQLELVNLTAGDTATGVATQLGIVTDSTTLTGLTPETSYAVYVRANCLAGTTSLWLGPLTFTTNPTCNPMTSADIMDVLDVTATGYWPSIESEWEIELVDLTAGNSFVGAPTNSSIVDTFFNFTSLTPDNDYAYKVRANCGVVDGNGGWSPAVNFTTDPSCIQPSDVEVTVTTNSIDVSWTSNDTEGSWAIDIVNVDLGESFTATADYVSSDTSYVINSLDPNTTYNVYVSAICSATDTSSWEASGEYTTLCLPATLPYVDSLNSWPTDCYSLSNSASTSENWSAFGTNGIIQGFSSPWTSGQTIFTMNQIDMTQQAILSFDWSSNAENDPDNWMRVEYTIDEGANWVQLWEKVGSDLHSNDGATQNAPGTFITENILLPASLVSEFVEIRFVHNFEWFDDRVFLDLIKVDTLPNCNQAYDLAMDTMIAGVPTFSFTDITGDDSQSWDYVITSDGPDIIGNTTVNPFDVTGLTPGVNYTIQMITNCSSDTTEATSGLGFMTPCAPLSYYFDGFESYPNQWETAPGLLPNCWDRVLEGSTTFMRVGLTTFSAGYNSVNALEFDNSSSGTQNSTHIIAITPELLNTSTSWLQFRHFTNDASAGDQLLVVGSMTDYTDEGTFVGLDTVVAADNAWDLYTFIPNEHPGFTGDRIAIRAVLASTFDDIYVDDVLYEEIPDCYYPEVAVDSANLTGVYATIDPFNSTDAVWELEFVNLTTGETVTGTPTDTVNTSVFYADGLMSSSTYAMYIRTNCGTESSIWSDPVIFTTECAPVTEFVQGWEAGTTCWTLYADGGANLSPVNDLITFPTNNGAFTNSMYEGFGDASQTNVYTVTPELSNLSDGTHWLTFNARNRWWTTFNTATIQVGTMSDPNDPSTFNHLQDFVLTNDYELYEYSFVSYTGTDSYIALKLEENSSINARAVIDDIVWEEAPECALPAFLGSDSIQDITAVIDWNPISADSAWYIELVNISAGDLFTGTATDSTDSHPHLLSGLVQNTVYGVKVRAFCDTNWSDEFLFTTLTSYDIAVSNFVNLGPNSCLLTTQEEATVTITNYGAQDVSTFDVYYSFDGVTYTNDGAFNGTLLAGEDTAYTLSTLFDFSTADTNLFIATSLVGDTIYMDNDSNSTNVINNGSAEIDLSVTTGQYSTEVSWNVIDTAAGNTVASFNSYFQNYTTTNHKVCVNVGTTYSMESWDSFGDGWNGGTYEITQCSGVLVVNNNGDSPSTPPHSGGLAMEAQEYFTVEECDDHDLAIISMDSLESDCGLTAAEQAYLSIINYGLIDIDASSNASIEYQVNNSGWTTLATINSLASGEDTLLALPTVNMLTPLSYTFDFKVVFADDENSTNDSLFAEIESIDTYTDVEQHFNDAKSGWTPHIITGTSHSWEWGVPTTSLIGAGVDGKAWITNLDGNMNLNEESFLLSPCFDLSAYTADAEISFDFIWTVAQFANHNMRFQSSIDGGASWTTEVTLPRNTTEWTERNLLVSSVSGESDVKFRFFMDNTWSNDAEGFGMDNFKLIEHVPYTDTTLIDLTVDNVTIPGFNPAIFDYDYEYPFGSTAIPVVDAEENAPFITSMTITQAPSLSDPATVVVVAEDTNYMATYTVNFIEGPADSNALLSNLTVDGSQVTGFDSLTFVYNVELPFGTTPVVPVVGTPEESTSTVTVVDATTYPGTTTVTVVAQDGVTTNDYLVNFTVAEGDSVSTLATLTVDGNSVTGFDPDTLEYTETVSGATAMVEYTTTSANVLSATLSSPNPQTVPSTVMVTVIAQDSSETVYTINLQNPQSSDATLIELNYEVVPGSGFISVGGFSSSVYTYTETLPNGSPVPTVEYVLSDINSSAVVINAPTLSDPTTVQVTAQDGSQQDYVINWIETAASTNNLLASLTFTSGELVQTFSQSTVFDPNENNYTLNECDPLFLTPVPTPSAVPQDANATIGTITMPATFTGDILVPCIAQNGDTNIYTITLNECIGQQELEEGTVSIFPNPSTGVINLTVKDVVKEFGVEVFNTTGQVVYSTELENTGSQFSVDLSTMADGLYHVVVKDLNTGLSTKEKISIIK